MWINIVNVIAEWYCTDRQSVSHVSVLLDSTSYYAIDISQKCRNIH